MKTIEKTVNYCLVEDKSPNLLKPYTVLHNPLYGDEGQVINWMKAEEFVYLKDAKNYIAETFKPQDAQKYKDIIETWVQDDETIFEIHEENGCCVLAYYYIYEKDSIAISAAPTWKIIFNMYYKSAIEDYLNEGIEKQTYFTNEQLDFLKQVCNIKESK